LTLLPILDQNHKGSVLKNCKSSTSDKFQTFKPIFGISCKFLAKNSIQMITCYEVQQLQLLGELSAREIMQPFRKIKARINDLR
jgi:hypothetical protein